ncbi:MAG: hypothetical protein WC517_00470 [Patescibacteria group bacterium]
MPIFQRLLAELNQLPQPEKQVEFIDSFRREKIKEIKGITKREVLIYFSDFKKNHPLGAITWEDKTCFADVIEGLDKKGVDIVIHSPGGSAEATQSLVCMLREHFDNVRFIVPNMAKSAATMMVLSGNEILMDDRSELGPIDPQIQINGNFVPAQTLIDGFEEAKKVITDAGTDILPAYLPLLNKYDLHILQICENAKRLSEELVKDWLSRYMFLGDEKAAEKAENIAKNLADHKKYLSHGRPIGINEARSIGIRISDLRDNLPLREKIWELYCILEIMLDRSPIIKLYENSNGVFLAKNIPFQQIMIPQVPQEQKTSK